MSEPIRHHYVPRFYLANWCERDGMIPFSMRAEDGSILQSRVKPSATAFENRLYSYQKVPEDRRQAIEKQFFAAEVDDKAASIYPKIVAGHIADLSEEERILWTRFLIASRIRVPEIIHDLKTGAATELRRSLLEDHEEFLSVRGEAGEETLLEWTENNYIGLVDNFGMMILPGIITDPKHTEIIANMHWWIEDLSRANVSLLTSDRPLWVSAGLLKPNCLLALSLSPDAVFFASRNRRLQIALNHQGPNHLVRRCNESLASQAARFVPNADLRWALLPRAEINNANLNGANLSEIHLEGADLHGSDFTGADFRGAYLSGAFLRGANLTSANLTSARNLTQAQLDTACGNSRTRLPEGMTIPVCR